MPRNEQNPFAVRRELRELIHGLLANGQPSLYLILRHIAEFQALYREHSEVFKAFTGDSFLLLHRFGISKGDVEILQRHPIPFSSREPHQRAESPADAQSDGKRHDPDQRHHQAKDSEPDPASPSFAPAHLPAAFSRICSNAGSSSTAIVTARA